MRVLASLTAAVALALPALPSDAYERTVRVPVAECNVTVTTYSIYVGIDRHARSVRVERSGDMGARTNC